MIGNILWVALGGALGSVSRLAIGMAVSHKLPISTLLVNTIGSLLIGILIRNTPHGAAMYYFGVVGFCGGFTTFSTFSLDALKMFREGSTTQAAIYALISMLVCIVAVAIGTRIKIN